LFLPHHPHDYGFVTVVVVVVIDRIPPPIREY
jgi:hypothetical protein